MYGYVIQDPVNLIDPSGFVPLPQDGPQWKPPPGQSDSPESAGGICVDASVYLIVGGSARVCWMDTNSGSGLTAGGSLGAGFEVGVGAGPMASGARCLDETTGGSIEAGASGSAVQGSVSVSTDTRQTSAGAGLAVGPRAGAHVGFNHMWGVAGDFSACTCRPGDYRR